MTSRKVCCDIRLFEKVYSLFDRVTCKTGISAGIQTNLSDTSNHTEFVPFFQGKLFSGHTGDERIGDGFNHHHLRHGGKQS